jgi:hypothetical protein
VFARPGVYRRTQMRQQARAGIGVIRQTFAWSKMERSPGKYDLRFYDQYVSDAARAGLTILPILFGPPAFRAQAPSAAATETTTAPPRSLAAMTRWTQALIARYGSDGSLWRQHPELPKKPITAWQVWNEPNLPAYWNGHPDARQYVRMLGVVGHGIHAADPSAQVVTAGLTESRLGIPFVKYLTQMYAAGASGKFDVLAVNAYAESARGIKTAVTLARRITAAAEDGDVPIWLTEFGWATPPAPRGSFTVSDREQASLVPATIVALARERERLRIQGIVYYQWRDAPVYKGGTDYWGLHTGLLSIGGSPKPSLRTFTRAANAAN